MNMKRKSILVVGGGGIGERHVRCFLATGRAEVSVCDANPERLAKLKESYPVKATFSDFNEVDPTGFDGILIATPANMHIPMALRCAEHRIPFLIEKPLSVNMEGVDRLIELARGIPCGVAYVRRSTHSFKRLKELAGSGITGRLRMGRFNFSQDYRKYRPDYQRIYYARADMGGGCILDAASHSINLAQWFFGEVDDTVAFYDRLEFEGVEVEDSSIILLRFREGGALVELFTNQFQQPNIVEIELIGNKGNLRYTVDGEMHKISFCNSDANKWEEMGRYRITRDDPFIAQAHDFLDAIEGGGALPTSIEEARETLAVALAAKAFQHDHPPRSSLWKKIGVAM
ncbi:MAG: Gfo/Idh/MocA family oxidoreductase [Firmicutes bacterium]|nr:Gfo/Idh/MocA family oxidoreductase [Bacillota bacterium]